MLLLDEAEFCLDDVLLEVVVLGLEVVRLLTCVLLLFVLVFTLVLVLVLGLEVVV